MRPAPISTAAALPPTAEYPGGSRLAGHGLHRQGGLGGFRADRQPAMLRLESAHMLRRPHI
eukprot:5437972-Pyramimonas_sp.AAC.1